jgi:hypothetical protein
MPLHMVRSNDQTQGRARPVFGDRVSSIPDDFL